jgi:hypothetical protein
MDEQTDRLVSLVQQLLAGPPSVHSPHLVHAGKVSKPSPNMISASFSPVPISVSSGVGSGVHRAHITNEEPSLSSHENRHLHPSQAGARASPHPREGRCRWLAAARLRSVCTRWLGWSLPFCTHIHWVKHLPASSSKFLCGTLTTCCSLQTFLPHPLVWYYIHCRYHHAFTITSSITQAHSNYLLHLMERTFGTCFLSHSWSVFKWLSSSASFFMLMRLDIFC